MRIRSGCTDSLKARFAVLLLRVAAAFAVAACRDPAVAAEESAQEWRVIHREGLKLPDHIDDSQGNRIAITGLSGITWLGDDSYAAVMDNSDRLLLFTLRLSSVGKPLEAANLRVVTLSSRHDYEDIAPCPAAVGRRLAPMESAGMAASDPFAFVCEEDTPAIHVVSLASGQLLETLPLPANLRSRRPNRGNESLCIDPQATHLWTANEEALLDDGPPAAIDSGTVVRLTRIPVDPARPPAAGPFFQAAYAVDAPHRFTQVFPGQPLSGLVALAAIGDGKLLALERSGGPGLPPFASRLYLVDTAGAVDVAAIDRGLASSPEVFLGKRLLWADSLGLNLEGLCLGPWLADGRRVLVAIADNGGIGTPNQVVGLELIAPSEPRKPAVLWIVLAIVAVTLVVCRFAVPLTSP